jgi:hypothetical protein
LLVTPLHTIGQNTEANGSYLQRRERATERRTGLHGDLFLLAIAQPQAETGRMRSCACSVRSISSNASASVWASSVHALKMAGRLLDVTHALQPARWMRIAFFTVLNVAAKTG